MNKINFDFPVTERTYKVMEERTLKLYIFEPEASLENRPAILFFNGGSFKQNPKTPAQFQHQADYFSSIGMVAICVDYRNGSDVDFLPTQSINDVRSAVKYVRRNAADLGINPNKIVVCGSSAGGYITVSSIMLGYQNDEKRSKETIPNYLIVLAADMDGVDIMRRRYPQLLDRAKELSPIHHVKKCLPPTLWISGTGDDLYEQNKDFIRQMNLVGNDITLKTYEGMDHGFFNFGRHENKYYHLTKQEIENYLKMKQVI